MRWPSADNSSFSVRSSFFFGFSSQPQISVDNGRSSQIRLIQVGPCFFSFCVELGIFFLAREHSNCSSLPFHKGHASTAGEASGTVNVNIFFFESRGPLADSQQPNEVPKQAPERLFRIYRSPVFFSFKVASFSFLRWFSLLVPVIRISFSMTWSSCVVLLSWPVFVFSPFFEQTTRLSRPAH